MTDVWEQAAQNTSGQQGSEASQLGESYEDQPSGLFATGGEGSGPSLMNKTHAVGTERTGVIAKPPYDKHSTTMAGDLKYWQGREKKPVTNAVNPATGEKNRPVKETVVVLDTEYTMSAEEARALNRDEPYEGGKRSVIVSGGDLKKLKEAIADAVKRGISIRSDADMVGKRLTVKRTGTLPNPHGGDPIKVHEYRIDNA